MLPVSICREKKHKKKRKKKEKKRKKKENAGFLVVAVLPTKLASKVKKKG